MIILKESLVQALLWLLARQGNPALLPWAFDRIGELFRNDPERYYQFLRELRESEEWVDRFFVGHQIGSLFRYRPEDVLNQLKYLSKDKNEMVREAAAHGWSEALGQDFQEVFTTLEALASHEEYAARRTAALGPVEYYRDENPTPNQIQRIETFWKNFEDDPRSGLRNLVRTQIQERYVENNGS